MDDLGWLDAIEARLAAATPPPWTAETCGDFGDKSWIIADVVRGKFGENAIDLEKDQATAEFIAHAPDDIDALVKTLRRVSALIPEWVVGLAEDQTWYAGPNVSVSEAQELPAVIAVRKAYIGALRAALAG